MAKTIINNTSQSKPTFAELFTPKLISILKEGYTLANFRADAVAGLTVAIVALLEPRPLKGYIQQSLAASLSQSSVAADFRSEDQLEHSLFLFLRRSRSTGWKG
jgi:hypothetical protein